MIFFFRVHFNFNFFFFFKKSYVLVAEKDGSTSFSIRKGSMRAIVEQIVLWLVRPPGSSKASQKSVQSQLQLRQILLLIFSFFSFFNFISRYFLCAHERVISTIALLQMLHDVHCGKDTLNRKLIAEEAVAKEGVFKFICFWVQSSYYPDFVGFDGCVNTETMAALHQFITSTFSSNSRFFFFFKRNVLHFGSEEKKKMIQ